MCNSKSLLPDHLLYGMVMSSKGKYNNYFKNKATREGDS